MGWCVLVGEPPTLAPFEGGAVELDTLLRTKLHIPRTRPSLVVRPRLVDRLTDALQGGLTVVCAPAGFGKTALLADWARGSGRVVAWLSLDVSDNDPVRFWRHVAAALEGVRAGVGRRLAVLLRPPPRSFEAVVTALVNELAVSRGELALVLDDYHLIESQAVHQQIARELVVALETAKKHVSHVLGKLGAANRTQAVARARELGLLR